MPNTDPFGSTGRSWFEVATDRFARKLVPMIYVVSALAFISDLARDNTLAYGIIYTPLIVTAVFHKHRVGLWYLTGVACLMVVLGAFVPMIDPDLPDMIGNRLLSVMAIISTAAFVYHSRETQDRLAAQTRRAEAAERMKTDVLNDLSEEIRTPLRTLLGVLTLTMAGSRPDQREALRRVQSDGKQLLATLDNLIDLSQVEAHTLQRQNVDVATVARDAVEAAGTAAMERQITVAMTPVGDPDQTAAVGDPWAVRRILDNFLANAVRLTPIGGTVSVSITRSDKLVTASVSDTGKGLPPELTRDFHEDAPANDGSALHATGGAGLALSSRLARTMNGRVIARNAPGSGATVSLSLTAAD